MPLLRGHEIFCIDINDVRFSSDMFKMIMYAGDTIVLCVLNNDNDIELVKNGEDKTGY